MSVRDRTRPAAARRLLGRALVVAGATVAGTSAVWLAGAGHPADAAAGPLVAEEAPVPAQTTESPPLSGVVDSRAGADPADSPLGDLDPRTLVRSEPAQQVLAPVGGALRDSTDGVRQLAEALPVTGPADVDGGRTPESPAPEPSVTTPTNPPTTPAPEQAHREPPRPAAPAGIPPHEPTAETRSAATAGMAPVAEQRTPEPPRAPGELALDRTPPATTGAGAPHTADLQQTGAALGRHPDLPRGDRVSRGALARHGERALLGVPAPRPGSTPD
ncbi:hypothetical protein [Saccharopolyspora griseoalba]|uniref:Uncharacterized protein n=1 Tax=Saccharopolyspora griseoalba TaxID=1431848 RepID=A0ABW2LN61_9PSEU